MENVVCNNCGAKNVKVIIPKASSWEYPGEFRIVKCKKCGLIFLNPRPSKKTIGNYYHSVSYWGNLKKDNTKRMRDLSYNYIYNLIFAFKKHGKVLDIGAGTGLFLSRFKNKNWKIDGVEFSKSAAKFSNDKFKIKLKVGDFLDFSFPSKNYDVVTLNNVLEHVPNPKKTLSNINRILKNDGILVVTIPNIESIGFKLFKEKWYALQPPRHFYHFSLKILSSLLTKSNFKIISVNRWYWIHNYAAIFESFRVWLSPRFKKTHGKDNAPVNVNLKTKKSMKKEAIKILFMVFSKSLAFLGSLMGKSEYLTLVCTKI